MAEARSPKGCSLEPKGLRVGVGFWDMGSEPSSLAGLGERGKGQNPYPLPISDP